MINSPERFAISLVSLALARQGYTTTKEIRYGKSLHADILAVKEIDNIEETFIVEVKAVSSLKLIPEDIDVLREQNSTSFGVTVYFAFFIDRDSLLIVDDELEKRMRFFDDEIRLESFSSKALLPRRGLATPS
jgi:hypothetical protein